MGFQRGGNQYGATRSALCEAAVKCVGIFRAETAQIVLLQITGHPVIVPPPFTHGNTMQKHLLTLALAAICATAAARPYPAHDKLLSQAPEVIISSAYSEIIQDLNAQNGKFDNDEDKKRALAETRTLIDLHEKVLSEKIITPEDKENYQEILWRLANLHGLAHQFGVSGAAEKADQYYQQVLPLLSGKEKARLQHQYGGLLSSLNQTDRALATFREAAQNGEEKAHRSLALLLSSLGKKEEAIQEMKTYIKQFPQDNEAQRILQAIEEDKLRLEQ